MKQRKLEHDSRNTEKGRTFGRTDGISPKSSGLNRAKSLAFACLFEAALLGSSGCVGSSSGGSLRYTRSDYNPRGSITEVCSEVSGAAESSNREPFSVGETRQLELNNDCLTLLISEGDENVYLAIHRLSDNGRRYSVNLDLGTLSEGRFNVLDGFSLRPRRTESIEAGGQLFDVTLQPYSFGSDSDAIISVTRTR